ncbi:MAG: hypothetical protein Q4A30_01835 [Candidatus Saccharibacteria bacterium]|nr:hypothetical protein [Candidatus Saccharibacteria bacterium]
MRKKSLIIFFSCLFLTGGIIFVLLISSQPEQKSQNPKLPESSTGSTKKPKSQSHQNSSKQDFSKDPSTTQPQNGSSLIGQTSSSSDRQDSSNSPSRPQRPA